jgi:hypothetical protein
MDHKDPLLSRVIYTRGNIQVYGPTALGWIILVILAPVILKVTFMLADFIH